MRVVKGHHLLRLTAITPANFGDTGGSATVDRPVALDVWSKLPYLPASALKGVVAGRLGNIEAAGGTINQRRATHYGAPGADGQGGAPAAEVIFGDGELLAFPLLLRDGRRIHVVPASTLYRLARGGLLGGVEGFESVDPENGVEGACAIADLPATGEQLHEARFGIPSALLAQLLDSPTVGDVLIAAPLAAGALWRAAVEERSLTAVGQDRCVVQGSLRRVETVPAGSQFVSVLTVLRASGADLDVAAPLQVGAWEAIGCGYLRAELVDLSGLAASQDEAGDTAHASSPAPSDQTEPPEAIHKIMRHAHAAVKELVGSKEAAVVRSAVFELGPRLKQWGAPRTLAFYLARAKAACEVSQSERRRAGAYRWLLSQLFDPLEARPTRELGERVIAAITGAEALPIDFEERLLWLRRYAESLLAQEKVRGKTEDV